MPAEQRGPVLDQACADDAALRRSVEAMLAADDGAETRLRDAVAAGWPDDELPGTPERIGPYRVIRKIGRGGFATVYLCERDDAQFSMRVAIKLVRRDLRSNEVSLRLRRERQILAGLDHPNIARILDGGSTADGTPYVVMEYINGQPVDAHCKEAGLSLRSRLELFVLICHAVRYAHQNLVLHRDIKPSNILVTEDGVPKLLDFGIAKLLQDDGMAVPARCPDLSATLTRTGVRVLTPEYASPEQILGQTLTTATDVYGLGVLLYRLVTNEHPYEFRGDRWAEVERVICDETPEAPSTVVARRKSAGPKIGSRTARRDLDTIVLTALRKRPARRYATVEQLAEDLRRYLHGLPILARSDRFSYRAGRFISRHRAAVVTTALVASSLVAATVVATGQAHRAHQARQRAELQQARASQIATFMEDLFESSDPYRPTGQAQTVREILDQGAASIGEELDADPELRAALMATMGRVYRRMDLFDEAEPLLQKALDVRRDVLGDRDLETAESWRDLGQLAIERGQCDAAETAFGHARALERSVAGEDSLALATTLHMEGQGASRCGDRARAGLLLQRALDVRRRHLGEEAQPVLETQGALADLAYQKGDYNQAHAAFEDILARLRSTLGDDHPEVATALSNLAVVTSAKGDPQTALGLWRAALEVRRHAFGPHHGSIAHSHYSIGIAHKRLGETTAAKEALQASLDLAVAIYGEVNPLAADGHHHLGELYQRLEVIDQAERHFREALDMRRTLYGEDHPDVAQSHASIAGLVARRDPEHAKHLYLLSIATYERALPGDYRASYPLIRLGDMVRQQGDLTTAEPLFRRALALRRDGLPTDHWEIAIAEAYLGQCLADLGARDEAEELLEASLQRLTDRLGAEDRRTKRAAERLATFREGA